MHSLPLSTYCLLCSVQGGESPWQRSENILDQVAVSLALRFLVVQRIGHLLGFASFPSQHTAGGEVSLLCQAGSELGDGTAHCTFSVLF